MLANNLTPLQQMEIEDLQELFEVLGIEPDETEIGEMTAEAKERFAITNLEQLNWALRKLSALQSQKANVDALHKAEVERINQWHAKEVKVIEGSKTFFENMIAIYASFQREADPKYKGEKTPYGRVGFRKQQPAWEYADEQATVEWLKENELDALVQTKETISNKTEFKKAFDVKLGVWVKGNEVATGAFDVDNDGRIIDQETGEIAEGVEYHEAVVVDRMTDKIVPGVKVTPKPDAIDVKPEA